MFLLNGESNSVRQLLFIPVHSDLYSGSREGQGNNKRSDHEDHTFITKYKAEKRKEKARAALEAGQARAREKKENTKPGGKN